MNISSKYLFNLESPCGAGYGWPVTTFPVYSIGAVARMVGIPAATLRTWEERYGLPVPARSPGGHRVYTRDQIDQLRFVKAQVGQGIAPADAHRLLADRMDRGGGSPFASPDATSTRLLILLAERDPYAAELAEYFLRTEGYEVAMSLDASDAARKSRQLAPSLIVIDLLISGGAGLELCRQLKRGSDLPVLAISTLETSDDALEAGADAFLQKPLDPLQLVSAVKDLLGVSAFLHPTGPSAVGTR
jgi:DNA-binding transcriptional MerR regulator